MTYSLTATKYQLPDFTSSFSVPLKINPHYPSASDVSDEWIGSYSIFKDKAFAEKFFLNRFGLLNAMCYPDANAERFRLCCDYMNLLFVFDEDADDGSLKEDAEKTRAAVKLLAKALRDPIGLPASFLPAQMLANYWERASLLSSAGAQKRFVAEMEHYLQGVHQQVSSRASKESLSVESFIKMRRNTSALRPMWAVIEMSLAIDLPDEVMEHPILVKMAEIANDMVAWGNDLYSWNAEQAKGHLANLVNVVVRERGMSLQESINFVGDMIKHSMAEFQVEKALIPRWGDFAIDDQVDAYVRGIEYWARGCFEWSFHTPRYFGAELEEIKRTRIVTVWKKELEVVQTDSNVEASIP